MLGKFKKEKTNIYLKAKEKGGGVRENDETGTKRVKKNP